MSMKTHRRKGGEPRFIMSLQNREKQDGSKSIPHYVITANADKTAQLRSSENNVTGMSTKTHRLQGGKS